MSRSLSICSVVYIAVGNSSLNSRQAIFKMRILRLYVPITLYFYLGKVRVSILSRIQSSAQPSANLKSSGNAVRIGFKSNTMEVRLMGFL